MALSRRCNCPLVPALGTCSVEARVGTVSKGPRSESFRFAPKEDMFLKTARKFNHFGAFGFCASAGSRRKQKQPNRIRAHFRTKTQRPGPVRCSQVSPRCRSDVFRSRDYRCPSDDWVKRPGHLWRGVHSLHSAHWRPWVLPHLLRSVSSFSHFLGGPF